MEKRKHVGWAWIGNTLLPIYSKRELRRGRNKGKWVVEYLNGWSKDNHTFKYKKVTVLKSDLQVDLSPSQDEYELKKREQDALKKAKEKK